MLRRKVYDRLMEWKSRDHKCLLVKGQRQVGKTFIIDKFGKDNYDHVVYLNFVEDIKARSIFDGNLDVDSILSGISIYYPDSRFIPDKTLLIFDEVQDCPRARTSLKFFSIDGRYDVIATGSLLGVDVRRRGESVDDAPVPVGYEEHLTMYSLDFEEFLWANGLNEDSISYVRACISRKGPLGAAFMDRFWSLFKDYMIVGGMPEAVQAFVVSRNFREAGDIVRSLMEAAKADINRYNSPVMANKIVSCLSSIPLQLSESNKKFMYSRIDGSGSRKSGEMYADSIDWIINAGYCNPCRKVSSLEPPLMSKEVRDHFKAYMSDTGLLMHMYEDDAAMALYSGDLSYNMGAVAENVVAECILKQGLTPRYYSKNKGEGRMELDFVLTLGMEVAVLEVKSGRSREYPSLGKVLDHHSVDRRIVLERSDIYVSEDGVEHYPLFAVAFLDSMMKPWDGPLF